MSTDFVAASFPVLSDRGDEKLREAEERATVRGHAAGYAAGHRQAEAESALRSQQLDEALDRMTRDRHAEIEGVVRSLDDVRNAFHGELDRGLAVTAEQLLHLAVDLAETIVGRSLADEKASVEAALGRVLAAADDEVVLEIRLHPADLALVPRAGFGDVRLVPDASLARGDATASLDAGGIDARLASAVRRVRDDLDAGAA